MCVALRPSPKPMVLSNFSGASPLFIAAFSACRAASIVRCRWTDERSSASPTLSKPWARPSSGSKGASSSLMPRRSFSVCSSSLRFKRRRTVALFDWSAVNRLPANVFVNLAFSPASGRGFFFGGISPWSTRSKMRTHLASASAWFRSEGSLPKSSPPLASSASWQSTQCFSMNGRSSLGGSAQSRAVPSRQGMSKRGRAVRRRIGGSRRLG